MKEQHTTDWRNALKWIYLYLFTAIGLCMFLIGSFNLVRHLTKRYLLPTYYLDYQESRCDYIPQTTNPDDPAANVRDPEAERQKCMSRLEQERKYQEVLDLSAALTMMILGSAVFAFHYRKTRTE